MPRASLPPTPAASGDIPGRNLTQLPGADKAFNLPPPAISQSRNSTASASAPKLIQSSTSPNFSLPPPPTRSRTIIQMKPKSTQNEPPAEKRPTSKGSAGSSKKANATSKRQPSSTSVAGKKIARKTAHSVIERRRRSKMNEEFGVLKAMIPACTDQEMHKLAILQASIDYLRYLENCITDLKAANKTLSTPLLQAQPPPPRINTSMPHASGGYGDDEDIEDEEYDEDIAMQDANSSASLTPALSAQAHMAGTSAYTSPQSIQHSPALDPPRTSHRGSYSSLSTLPSPAFGPQKSYTNTNNSNNGGHHRNAKKNNNNNTDYPSHPQSSSTHPSQSQSQSQFHNNPLLSLSASTSPTMLPTNNNQEHHQQQRHPDHEATAALLMLNQDRRSTNGSSGRSSGGSSTSPNANANVNPNSNGGRGMSVKDLLSC